MSDRDALYRAILANPADDTPRLAYADWLEENGHSEEAEFIRLGCQLETITPDDPDFTSLVESYFESQLWLSTHVPGPKLKFPAGLQIRGGNWWGWSLRGFPQFLHYGGDGRSGLKPMRMLGAALEKAFATVPTRWLVVQGVTVAQLAELLKQSAVAGLSGLTIQLDVNDEEEPDTCRLIGECPMLRNLRSLSIQVPLGAMGLARLAESSNFGALRWLSVDHCEGLTPNAVAGLRESNWFRCLKQLILIGLPSAGFEELCRLPPLSLHTLEVQEAAFEPTAWQTFARSSTFSCLTRLVNSTDMSQGGMEALAAADRFQLTHLEMSGNAIRNAGAEALADARWLDTLRWLQLTSQLFGPAGVAALTRSRRLANLRFLNIAGNGIGRIGLRAIATNPALRGVTTLLLRHNAYMEFDHDLTASDYARFLAKLDMPNLRHLDLSGRSLGPQAARLLAHEKFHSLTRLNLSECKLTDPAASELLAAHALQNLVQLDLRNNGLRTGVALLTDRGVMPRLSNAMLTGNAVSAELIRKLRRRPGIHT